MSQEHPRRKPTGRGRPRSEASHQAILDAAIAMIAGDEGISGLSIEALADRAGVGKATIYRRWPNMDSVLLDAFESTIGPPPDLPGRSAREDLILLLRTMIDQTSGVGKLFNARLYAARLIEGDRNPDFMQRYREKVVEPRRKLFQAVIRGGQKSGELSSGIDVEIAQHLLVTPVLHRLMALRAGEPFPETFIERLVDSALTGLGDPIRRRRNHKQA